MALDIMAAFTNEPPELDFIWPGFLAGTVGALVAPGATGKSFFALEAAMSIACSVAGGDLVGLAPAHTGRVVYLAGEDPQPALVRRVHAIGQHLNQSAREAIADRPGRSRGHYDREVVQLRRRSRTKTQSIWGGATSDGSPWSMARFHAQASPASEEIIK